MTEKKTESEPREEDEELKLEKEKIRDLDVPRDEGAGIKGGRGCPQSHCSEVESGCAS